MGVGQKKGKRKLIARFFMGAFFPFLLPLFNLWNCDSCWTIIASAVKKVPFCFNAVIALIGEERNFPACIFHWILYGEGRPP